MQYCKRCVQPDTRPGLEFDKEGICFPCRYFEKLNTIDWEKRQTELREIAQWGRQTNVSGYDCIIGVSGGKDSTRQGCYIKEELGLKPLMVCCSYPPEQLTERGAYNLGNLIKQGLDCITVSPDPQVWKTLMLQGFLKHGNWCKSTEMALYACLPKTAIAYHIPLIFLGENPSVVYGDFGAGDHGGDGNQMKYSSTLSGGDPTDLLTGSIIMKDTYWYRYPEDEEMDKANLRIVYLGHYVRDFFSYHNADFSISRGLMLRDDSPEDIGTTTMFDALDDDFVIVNQMLKYVKFGFGKMVDMVNDAIHLGLMSREEAIDFVNKYDGLCAEKYIEKYCHYLGITREKFWEIAESYRNKFHDIWEKDSTGKWNLKFKLENADQLVTGERSRE